MSAEQAAALEALMAEVFTGVDLNLYLDTHPWDKQALMYFNRHSAQLMERKHAYEAKYGPLLGFGFSPSPDEWRWIMSPWPWEMA